MADINQVLYSPVNNIRIKPPKGLTHAPVLHSVGGSPIIRSQPVYSAVHVNDFNAGDVSIKDYGLCLHNVTVGSTYDATIAMPLQFCSPQCLGLYVELGNPRTWTLPTATALITFITNKYGAPVINQAWEIPFRTVSHNLTFATNTGGGGGKGHGINLTYGSILFIITDINPNSYAYQAWIRGCAS